MHVNGFSVTVYFDWQHGYRCGASLKVRRGSDRGVFLWTIDPSLPALAFFAFPVTLFGIERRFGARRCSISLT